MDRSEYNKCVKDLSGNVFRFVRKYVRDTDDANDLVQDAFEKLWLKKENVPVEKAKAWLFTVSYNASMNFLKKSGRQSSIETTEAPILKSEDQGKRYELKEAIDLALARLPDQQRSIILLRDLEGYNYADIGEILELSESQVKVYLFRARKKIKEFIKDLSILT